MIEDSPAGVEAALAAGLHCIAVTTPFTGKSQDAPHFAVGMDGQEMCTVIDSTPGFFTRQRIHDQGLLEERWIVDDGSRSESLLHKVRRMIGDQRAKAETVSTPE